MMKQKLLTSLFLSLVLSLTAQAQQELTVAQDESGDYTTIQDAIDAVAEGAEATITIKAGTYDGMVKIGKRTQASTKKISLIGEGMDKTIITAANGKNNIGILITDHNVHETLNITDRAYLLFEGKILFQGKPEELAQNPIVREKYLGSNFVLQKKDFQ